MKWSVHCHMAFFMIFTTSLLPMTQKVHIVYLYVKPLCLFVCLWQIKAIHYNDTGIADRTIHLFKGPTWSAELLLNLTTGSDGVAQFSLNTTTFTGDFELIVSWVCVFVKIYLTHTHTHTHTHTGDFELIVSWVCVFVNIYLSHTHTHTQTHTQETLRSS